MARRRVRLPALSGGGSRKSGSGGERQDDRDGEAHVRSRRRHFGCVSPLARLQSTGPDTPSGHEKGHGAGYLGGQPAERDGSRCFVVVHGRCTSSDIAFGTRRGSGGLQRASPVGPARQMPRPKRRHRTMSAPCQAAEPAVALPSILREEATRCGITMADTSRQPGDDGKTAPSDGLFSERVHRPALARRQRHRNVTRDRSCNAADPIGAGRQRCRRTVRNRSQQDVAAGGPRAARPAYFA